MNFCHSRFALDIATKVTKNNVPNRNEMKIISSLNMNIIAKIKNKPFKKLKATDGFFGILCSLFVVSNFSITTFSRALSYFDFAFE